MAISLLITQTEVINTAFTNQNISDNQIKDTFIEVAQLEHIRPALTDDLYDDVLANPTSDANKALMPFIKKALAFYVKYEALPDMHVEATKQGLQINTNEFGTAASDKGRADLRQTAFNHGQTYKDELTKFIEHDDNKATYEDLYASESSINNKSSFTGGIVISKKKPVVNINVSNENALLP